ncbi:ATP-binding protein [Mycobacterium sp. 2YAF39]|uniref:ATP-binding protein n=1 Tax=Mycobacterium sp. 2YAF39 TaxID=3233033 RepID=UPI003F9C0B8A
MTQGPAGYSLGNMTNQSFALSAADADFVCVDAADARSVSRLRQDLARWLRTQVKLDREKLDDVLLAVNEALTNSAEFAYRGRPQQGTMTLQVHYDAREGVLLVQVSDQGTWRHVDPADQPNTRGRGIPLMRAMADDITISRTPNGTHVQMRFGDCARIHAQAYASV